MTNKLPKIFSGSKICTICEGDEEMMKLKVSKESKTGLNTEFVNIESGRKIKREQAI